MPVLVSSSKLYMAPAKLYIFCSIIQKFTQRAPDLTGLNLSAENSGRITIKQIIADLHIAWEAVRDAVSS